MWACSPALTCNCLGLKWVKQSTAAGCIYWKQILKEQWHTWLTVYYIRPFLHDINVSLWFSQCYFMKCIGYNTNCIRTHLIWFSNSPNTVCIVINTHRKVTLTFSVFLCFLLLYCPLKNWLCHARESWDVAICTHWLVPCQRIMRCGHMHPLAGAMPENHEMWPYALTGWCHARESWDVAICTHWLVPCQRILRCGHMHSLAGAMPEDLEMWPYAPTGWCHARESWDVAICTHWLVLCQRILRCGHMHPFAGAMPEDLEMWPYAPTGWCHARGSWDVAICTHRLVLCQRILRCGHMHPLTGAMPEDLEMWPYWLVLCQRISRCGHMHPLTGHIIYMNIVAVN